MYRYSIVKSVQTGVINFAASTATSGTATITAVTTANSVLSMQGLDADASTGAADEFYLALTNSTTVTATRIGSAAVTANVSYAVVEYVSNILKSKQEVDIALTGATTSNTATITSVTTTKSYIAWRGLDYNAGDTVLAQILGSLRLTNATTVTAVKESGTSNINVHGTVVEFR